MSVEKKQTDKLKKEKKTESERLQDELEPLPPCPMSDE